jgi:hypothetical protein
MRYIKYLIDQVRKQTENEDFSDFTGIQDSEFIQYINDAQHELQATIVHQHPRVFMEETTITTTPGQERYDLPSDCYLGNKVHNVEYSATGVESDFYTLDEDTLKRRDSGITGSPSTYVRLAGQILLSPQPQTAGILRINYVKRVRQVDLRMAEIDTQFTTSTTASVTASLNNASTSTETESLQEHDYVCIVDKEGTTILANIPLVQVTNTTLELGATSASVTIPSGSYIVGGKDTSTHGDFDRSVERYIISYCAWKILKRDSSMDSQEAVVELERMKAEIIKSYAMISDDVQMIPQLNSWEDWSI